MRRCREWGTSSTHLIGNALCVKPGTRGTGANGAGVRTTAVRVVKKSIGSITRKPVTLGTGVRDAEERVETLCAAQTAR